MFQLPALDPRIPCELVPQASRRRGAVFARTLLRAGIVDAGLLPASPGPDHIKTCQGVVEGWIRRELDGLRLLRPYFSMLLRDAGDDDGRAARPACIVEWGGESFGVRNVGPALEYLENHCPKLGRTVLGALERCAWRTLPIYTPGLVLDCASDTYWHGEPDEQVALDEYCGDDAKERASMLDGMVTRAMFDQTFPAWALGGRARPLGRRALSRLAGETKDHRIASVVESVLSLLAVDLPAYDWSWREGRFVGFSGVLAWNDDDVLTMRVLDDFEQMSTECGDYFEACGEHNLGAEDHKALAGWFGYIEKWCVAVKALDDLIWKLTDGNWPPRRRGQR